METEERSASYYLGYYIGEHILSRYLPTLSTDDLQSPNVVKVTEQEEEHCKKLNDEWFESYELGKGKDTLEAKRRFKNLLDYQNTLASKYLKETLEIPIPDIELSNIESKDFIQGIKDNLWDCDLSWYVFKEVREVPFGKKYKRVYVDLELELMDISIYDV